MPFPIQEDRKRVDEGGKLLKLGSITYLAYAEIMKRWNEKKSWSTAMELRQIFKRFTQNDTFVIELLLRASGEFKVGQTETAIEAAYDVFFNIHVMDYEMQMIKKNGDIGVEECSCSMPPDDGTCSTTYEGGVHMSKKGDKFDEGKPPIALVPYEAIWEEAKVMEFGAGKYSMWNLTKGLGVIRLCLATMRHILQFLMGEDNAPESGISPLAHAWCDLGMAIWMLKHKPEFDDRRKNETAQ